MTDLETLRARTLTILQDPGKIIFSDEDVDSAIRLALLKYSTALPYGIAAVLTLTRPGNEIDLSSLPSISAINRVYYPWSSTLSYSQQQPNVVKSWDFYRNGASSVILLDTSPVNPDRAGAVPAAGEEVRVHYDTVHTIEGLDGALQTTVPVYHFDLIARGAAGSALLFAAVNRGEVLDQTHARNIAAVHLESFNVMLTEIQAASQRAGSIHAVWSRMDKFDRVT